MDKKIFEKKMRNKYIITAVSFLVATLFIGTAMTSAIAGSVVDKNVVNKSQPSSTSAKATGCTLCAGQGNTGELNGEANAPLPNCTEIMLGAAIIIGYNVLTALSNIIQNIDMLDVYKLMQNGKTMLQAIVAVVLEFIQNNQELLQTIGAIVMGAIDKLIDLITDPEVLQFIWDTAVYIGIVTVTFIIANLPAIIAVIIFGIGKLAKIANDLADLIKGALYLICELLKNCPPQQLGMQSSSTDSQVMMQNTVQTIASTTQQSSVVSSQSSSVISQTTVTPSTQQSTAPIKTGATSTLSIR